MSVWTRGGPLVKNTFAMVGYVVKLAEDHGARLVEPRATKESAH